MYHFIRASRAPLVVALSALGALAGTARTAAPPPTSTPTSVDCSEAYGGKPATCRVVPCSAEYASFRGAWSGAFFAYERSLKRYRPLHNETVYDGTCAENIGTREVFTIGRETNTYEAFETLPAKTVKGLLVFGRDADAKPFMRTVGDEGVYTYAPAYRNTAANLSIWQLEIPAANGQPAMAFATIDGRNPNVQGAHERQVTVTMRIGPADKPVWEGIVMYGAHTQKP